MASAYASQSLAVRRSTPSTAVSHAELRRKGGSCSAASSSRASARQRRSASRAGSSPMLRARERAHIQ
eukprot:2294060-Prymnesium_polylepis.2